MNITVLLPSIVGVLYFITGCTYLYRKEYDWATVWIGYSIAQIGLVVAGNK